jgi:site-specific recombinase XerD
VVAQSVWTSLLDSWLRSLRVRNLSPATLKVYERSARFLIDYLLREHPTVTPDRITREHVETFLADYSTGRSAATASQVFRSLQQWMRWLVREGEIDADPMGAMIPPLVPETPVPILTDDELRALLASCEGRRLVDRRDMALFRLLIDTGGRLSEISHLQVDDVNLEAQFCRVTGKGRKERFLPFGVKTADALDRYLRMRRHDPRAADPGLWLGEKGKGGLTSNGVYQVVKRRGRALGLPDLHPHTFRHTSSHRWLAAGGSEGDLMQLNGWKSRSMLQRYASSAAAERARDAHRRMGLGDQI